MIPGVTASQIIGARGDAGEVPEGTLPNGAIAMIDFINGEYYANGSFLPRDDVVIGDPLTQGSGPLIVTATGVKILNNDVLPIAGPALLQALNNEIASSGGFSVYHEWETVDVNIDSLQLLFGTIDGDFGDIDIGIEISDGGQQVTADKWIGDWTFSVNSDSSPLDKVNPGINQVAVGLAASVTDSTEFRYSLSLNGGDPKHDSGAGEADDSLDLTPLQNSAAGIELMYIGGRDNSGGSWLPFGGGAFFTWVRKTIFFPPVDENDIQFISDNGALP